MQDTDIVLQQHVVPQKITFLFVASRYCLKALLLSWLLLQLSQPWDTLQCCVTLICLDWTEVTIVGQHIPCQTLYRTMNTHTERHTCPLCLSAVSFVLNVYMSDLIFATCLCPIFILTDKANMLMDRLDS